jgi:hypothetical protein
MASIDDFLKATDLDDLLKIRRQIGGLSADDASRVTSILREWKDGQAVFNLLIHSSLVPEEIRCEIIDRALHDVENPYFALAAVVGLNGIKPETVESVRRKRWVSRLLVFVRSNSGVLSERSSVTIRSWLKDDDDIKDFVCSYPVPNETASKNILSFTLERFGKLTRQEYSHQLQSYGLGFWKRRPFLSQFAKYTRKKKDGSAIFMTTPLLAYIPNYKPVSRSQPH